MLEFANHRSVSLRSLQKMSTNSMAEELTIKIKDMILSGELTKGYTFPNENEMCKLLNIGRSTLREAYKALEIYGMITRSRRGTLVNEKSKYDTNSIFTFEMERSDYDDLMVFRNILEKECVGLMALNATEDEVTELETILLSMEVNLGETESFSYFDSQFHLKIAEYSHNKLLSNIFNMNSEVFFRGIKSAFHVMDDKAQKRALDFHKKIFSSIKGKSVEEAMKHMRNHINDIAINTNKK